MLFCKLLASTVAILCLIEAVRTQAHRNVAIAEHNRYRGMHGVPNVNSPNSDINNHAQQWATHLATHNEFRHSGGPFGENLFGSWGGSRDLSVIMANAIRTWYDQVRLYNWNNPGFSAQTGHFTQVVWRASTEIGIGIAVANDAQWGSRAVVCITYRPRGNVQGQFPQNVLRPVRMNLNNYNYTISEEDKPVKFMVL